MQDAGSQSGLPRRSTVKTGVIVPHSPKWHQRLGAWILWAVLTLVSATLRYRINDPHGFMMRKDIGQVIYCTGTIASRFP